MSAHTEQAPHREVCDIIRGGGGYKKESQIGELPGWRVEVAGTIQATGWQEHDNLHTAGMDTIRAGFFYHENVSVSSVLLSKQHQKVKTKKTKKSSLTLHFFLNRVCQCFGQLWDLLWVILHPRQLLPHDFTDALLHNGWFKSGRFNSEKKRGRKLNSISLNWSQWEQIISQVWGNIWRPLLRRLFASAFVYLSDI